jgi:hypothetical protein
MKQGRCPRKKKSKGAVAALAGMVSNISAQMADLLSETLVFQGENKGSSLRKPKSRPTGRDIS